MAGRLYRNIRWLFGLVLALFLLSIFIITGSQAFKLKAPPFAELQVAEGELDFRPSTKNAGWAPVLRNKDKELLFTCQMGTSRNSCFGLKVTDRKKLAGKSARVHWFERRNFYEGNRYPLQLEVEGEIIKSYEESVKDITFRKWLLLGFWSLLFFLGVAGRKGGE